MSTGFWASRFLRHAEGFYNLTNQRPPRKSFLKNFLRLFLLEEIQFLLWI